MVHGVKVEVIPRSFVLLPPFFIDHPFDFLLLSMLMHYMLTLTGGFLIYHDTLSFCTNIDDLRYHSK